MEPEGRDILRIRRIDRDCTPIYEEIDNDKKICKQYVRIRRIDNANRWKWGI